MKRSIDEQQQHKPTPEEDEAINLQYNRIFHQSGYPFLDIWRGNTRLLRVSVMRYPHPTVGSPRINMKQFKWDNNRQNYLLHTQTGLTLEEFKSLIGQLGGLDTLIDDALNVSLSIPTCEDHTLSPHPTPSPGCYELEVISHKFVSRAL